MEKEVYSIRLFPRVTCDFSCFNVKSQMACLQLNINNMVSFSLTNIALFSKGVWMTNNAGYTCVNPVTVSQNSEVEI